MPKIKISATRIKSWFQYRCERKFIYSAIIPRNTEDSKHKSKHEYSFIEKKPEDEDRSWADAGNVFEDNLIVKQLNPTPQNACFEQNTDPNEPCTNLLDEDFDGLNNFFESTTGCELSWIGILNGSIDVWITDTAKQDTDDGGVPDRDEYFDGTNPENNQEILLNSGRFGPYLKCENKSARLENVEDIFTIGLNRAITLIADAKPGRISSSLIKDLGEHPEDKKPVRIMKGQYGPYIKYKSLNATIPEEKDPTEITMEEALILIEKRREYDRNKKKKKK